MVAITGSSLFVVVLTISPRTLVVKLTISR